jgi:hypothetical protein
MNQYLGANLVAQIVTPPAVELGTLDYSAEESTIKIEFGRRYEHVDRAGATGGLHPGG